MKNGFFFGFFYIPRHYVPIVCDPSYFLYCHWQWTNNFVPIVVLVHGLIYRRNMDTIGVLSDALFVIINERDNGKR